MKLALLSSFVLLAACQGSAPQQPASTTLTASATFINGKGDAIGTAQLTQVAEGVKIDVELSGLPPGTHAFHIHNVGKCHVGDEKTFSTAGPHFNPFGKKHGKDSADGPHAGDLPNFEAKPDGTAKFSVVATLVTLRDGEKNSLFQPGGTCLMVHEKGDDYKTDPTGDAGSRLGCGEIKK